MGPFVYKTVYVSIGLFASVKNAPHKIQEKIDQHVASGWELFEFHPIQTSLAWKWNIIIFRKPSS